MHGADFPENNKVPPKSKMTDRDNNLKADYERID